MNSDRENTIARLRYCRERAPHVFAILAATLFGVFSQLLNRMNPELNLVFVLLGVSVGYYLSRYYVSLIDGVLVIAEESPNKQR